MEITEYQRWLATWDQERGWDRVPPAHTLVHALEEMGEVARLVLKWEGYKPTEDADDLRRALREELSDLLVFVFKLANQTGVDLDEALCAGRVKAEHRYADIEAARAELDRFEERQREIGAIPPRDVP